MDALITNGDFDFLIFAQTPNPPAPAKKEEKPARKRNIEDVTHNNNSDYNDRDNYNNNNRGRDNNRNQSSRYNSEWGDATNKYKNYSGPPVPSWQNRKVSDYVPVGMRGDTEQPNKRAKPAANQKGSIPSADLDESNSNNNNNNNNSIKNITSNNMEDSNTQNNSQNFKNNNITSNKKGTTTNNNKEGAQFDKSSFSQAWEPDASDIQNVIAVEKSDEGDIFAGQFEDLGLSKRVVSTITNNMKLSRPTHIQHAAIPQIIKGHDVLLKAETGSGKTLAYVLPMLHAIGNIEPHINRKDGAYGIVIAPTRELVSQIYEIICQVAKTWIWVVPGYLSGGENRSSEKNRLRKGVNVLVATPGRLIDHLTTTACFKFDKLRFFVLDEADRLLDMGFGPKVAEIVNIIENPTPPVVKDSAENNFGMGNPWATENATEKKEDEPPKEKLNKTIKFTYEDDEAEEEEAPPALNGKRYQTILASATLHNGVRQLASLTLKEPMYIGLKPQAASNSTKHARVDIEAGQEYDTPTHLKQYYCVMRTKERLSSLISLLQQCAEHKQKLVIFVASCDIVDFYYDLFHGVDADPNVLAKPRPTRSNKDSYEEDSEDEDKSEADEEEDEREPDDEDKESEPAKPHVPLINAPIYKLHGDLTQVERNNAYNRFKKDEAAILISTDVSARGLDFPDIDWIVQYDPPADTKDYIHRVGRTARMGRQGSSLLYLIPEEEEYVKYLNDLGLKMEQKTIPPAHTTQLMVERYVEDNKAAFSLARAAYVSSVRAYSTHTTATKHIFRLSNLHVGHLAKAYGLRDKPSELSAALRNQMKGKKKADVVQKKMQKTKKIMRAPPTQRAVASEFDAGL